MTAKIGAAARAAAAAPGTEIVAVNPESGPVSIEGYYDEASRVPGHAWARSSRAERAGRDAHIIACFDDTGLEAARSARTRAGDRHRRGRLPHREPGPPLQPSSPRCRVRSRRSRHNLVRYGLAAVAPACAPPRCRCSRSKIPRPRRATASPPKSRPSAWKTGPRPSCSAAPAWPTWPAPFRGSRSTRARRRRVGGQAGRGAGVDGRYDVEVRAVCRARCKSLRRAIRSECAAIDDRALIAIRDFSVRCRAAGPLPHLGMSKSIAIVASDLQRCRHRATARARSCSR